MSFYLMDIKDQLEIANQLKVLELCLKYPEQEEMINKRYKLARSRARS